MEHWKRCKEMYRTLEQKLDALFQNSSITPQALHRFLSDPKNFSREQWIAIEEAKEKNKERFLELSQQLSSEGKEAVQSYLVASRQKEEPSQVRKEGQKKTSGSKKKILPRHKWLEMH